VFIRAFFGFRPSLNLAHEDPLWQVHQPRGFSGTLSHLRWGRELLTIHSGPEGLTWQRERQKTNPSPSVRRK
jgi:hypothetical protein